MFCDYFFILNHSFQKTKALKQQLEEYKDYKAKFAIAEENSERLKLFQSELEEKLVEALDREKKAKERSRFAYLCCTL